MVESAGRIGRADGMIGVEHHLDVQAVVTEDAAAFCGAYILSRIAQGDAAAGIAQVRPRSLLQRHGLVEEGLGAGHNTGAADGVVAAARRQVAQNIRAVEGVIQAAPAGVGGVQHEAGVQRRHDQLRPRHRRHLGVHIRRADCEGRRLGHEVADVPQESLGGRRVIGLSAPFQMPGVNPRLQLVPPRQQPPVPGREPLEDRRRPGPEGDRLDPQPRQGLSLDEGGQLIGDHQTGARRHRHGDSLRGLPETFRDDPREVERFSQMQQTSTPLARAAARRIISG